MINRLGSPTQEHRPLTPYERGQMITHYPTVGPHEMAERLKRSYASIRYHWKVLLEEMRDQRAAA